MYIDQKLTIDTNQLKVEPVIVKSQENFSFILRKTQKNKSISSEKLEQIENLYSILDPVIQENINFEDFKSWVLRHSFS